MENIAVEYIPVGALTAYEKNARKHEEYDVDKIMASIEEFGFNDPIGVWGKKNVIVEGHGRLMAAKKLGLEKVPVIHLDHLSDKQRKAYALAHNKTAELSRWDFGALEEELAGLADDFDMSDFGFEIYDYETPETPTSEYPSYEQTYGGTTDTGFKDYQEPLSADELKAYTENEDDYLLRRRVIITYKPEQEEIIRKMLGVKDGRVQVSYSLDQLLEME